MAEKILLVDDDEMLLRCAKRYLGRRFSLETVGSGVKGLKALDELAENPSGDAFALIISDMSMPRMNGHVFLQKAKAKSPQSLLFLLTGNQDYQTDVQVGSKFDGLVDAFLRKPCDPELLAEKITWGLEEYSRRKNLALV